MDRLDRPGNEIKDIKKELLDSSQARVEALEGKGKVYDTLEEMMEDITQDPADTAVIEKR